MDKRIIGFFDDRSSAQSAVNSLLSSGLDRSEVNLLPSDDTVMSDTSMDRGTDNKSFMQKVKDFFSGTDEYGMSDDERGLYAENIRRGSYMVSVDTDEARAERAADILSSSGAIDVDRRGQYLRETGWTGYNDNTDIYSEDERMKFRNDYSQWEQSRSGSDTDKTEVLPVIEEKINIGKRAINRGGVRILSRVTERPVQESVTLREEHVDVNRQPVDRPVNTADMAAFKEGQIEITERGEEAVVDKEARVVEEVAVTKHTDQRTETIQDTVRRKDVEVERMNPKDNPRH